jgi:hypothetical protein
MLLPNYIYGVPYGFLQVFIIILYENPELFPLQVSLSYKQSTLVLASSAALISTLLLLFFLLVEHYSLICLLVFRITILNWCQNWYCKLQFSALFVIVCLFV